MSHPTVAAPSNNNNNNNNNNNINSNKRKRDENQLWSRIVKRRKTDTETYLEEVTIVSLVKDAWLNLVNPPTTISKPIDKLSYLLTHLCENASNEDIETKKRRSFYTSLRTLLSHLDTSIAKKQIGLITPYNNNTGFNSTTTTTATNGSTTTAGGPSSSSSQINGISRNTTELPSDTTTQDNTVLSSSNDNTSTNGVTAMTTSATTQVGQLQQQQQQQRRLTRLSAGQATAMMTGAVTSSSTTTTAAANHHQQRTYVPSAPGLPTSFSPVNGAPTSLRSTVSPSTRNGRLQHNTNNIRNNLLPIAPSLQRQPSRGGSIAVSHVPSSRQSLSGGSSLIRKNTSNARPILAEKPRVGTIPVEIIYGEDPVESPFSMSLYARKSVKAMFRKQFPTPKMSEDMLRRLRVWDPFWRIEEEIISGLTSPLDDCKWKDTPLQHSTPQWPNTAASFHFSLTREQIKYVAANVWGQRKSNAAIGEYRLILRMLPVNPTPNKSRADCHLWPKGTYLTICGNPTILKQQRKQQSHDAKKWLGMSHPLDATPFIKHPLADNKIDICFHDTTQYYYCLAICQYRSSDSIYKEVEGSSYLLERLSMEESIQKAMKLISQQMIVIDDEDDGMNDNQEDVGKFVFSLTCPISKALMKTPVRGRNCKHWQCFDLHNYIMSNVSVSGGRWRCASCETFVAHDDLQFCGLTNEALDRYKNEASPQRDRIEFRGDKTYHLLNENKRRYDKKKPNGGSSNGNSNGSSRAVDEIVEVIID